MVDLVDCCDSTGPVNLMPPEQKWYSRRGPPVSFSALHLLLAALALLLKALPNTWEPSWHKWKRFPKVMFNLPSEWLCL